TRLKIKNALLIDFAGQSQKQVDSRRVNPNRATLYFPFPRPNRTRLTHTLVTLVKENAFLECVRPVNNSKRQMIRHCVIAVYVQYTLMSFFFLLCLPLFLFLP